MSCLRSIEMTRLARPVLNWNRTLSIAVVRVTWELANGYRVVVIENA